MSKIVNIFLEPTKVFVELKDKPSFVLPLLLLSIAMAVMTFLYFSKVDNSWFIEHTLMASGKEMSTAEMTQAKSFMPDTKTMGIISAITTPLFLIVYSLLIALYYVVAGKLSGSAIGFKNAISLASWASMPMLLSTIVALVGIFLMSPQTSLESLMLTNVDPLLIQLPIDSSWKKLATSFSLVNFWTTYLTALGWKTWFKTSWVEAIVVAIIPILVIYGGMAAWALV